MSNPFKPGSEWTKNDVAFTVGIVLQLSAIPVVFFTPWGFILFINGVMLCSYILEKDLNNIEEELEEW